MKGSQPPISHPFWGPTSLLSPNCVTYKIDYCAESLVSCCRFDEKLNNVLDPEHAATDVKMDSRLQRRKLIPLIF